MCSLSALLVEILALRLQNNKGIKIIETKIYKNFRYNLKKENILYKISQLADDKIV